MMSKAQTLRTAAQLCAQDLAPRGQLDALAAVTSRYAVALPPALAALIDRTDPHDPIARQFVPSEAELDHQPQELDDPIGDDAHSPVEGIVHRYPDRVLLKLTHVCAVYCRFCFRREMVGPDKPNALSREALANALDYIRSHTEVWEVILTGGDPLVLSARRLREVMKALGAIDHVKVVRIHTRMPVADPARISPDLVRAMKIKGKAVYVAVHVNHARELSPDARVALARMVDAGLPLLAQTVLIAGVNHTPEAMGDLMRALVENPGEALLFAPWRSGARHQPSAHRYRHRAKPDARNTRPAIGPVSADLCARYSRRSRQIADRAELSRTDGNERQCEGCGRGFQRQAARLYGALAAQPLNAGSTPDRRRRRRWQDRQS